MLGKITKVSAERLELGQLLWDTGVVGLGARRQRRDVFYLLRYRLGGRQRFITIGRHGSPFTPDTARNEAKRLLGLVVSGIDPARERKPSGDTFGATVPAFLGPRRGSVKPRTFTELERHLTLYAKPLHLRPLADVDRRAIALCLAQIETDNGAVTRNRVCSSLSRFFNWAISEGLLDTINPVTGTGKANEGGSRERVLSTEEIVALWRALSADTFGSIVKLLLLTGQRRNEIGGLRWSEVDLAKGVIVLPGSRTKNGREHTIPLSGQAQAIIEAQPRRNTTELVCGAGADGFSGWAKGKAALHRKLRIAPWRLHDLRRSAATGMAELGVQPHIIEAVLNRVSSHKAGVAGIYNRARYAGEMREALQKWADHLEEICEQKGRRE
jgi:integrase